MSEEEKDEHGCIIGKEKWDEAQEKCVSVEDTNGGSENAEEILKNIKNPAVRSFVDSALAEIPALKKQLTERDDLVANLTKQLDEANDLIKGHEKGQIINEIIPISSFSMHDLVDKTNEELKGIKTILLNAKNPKLNSVAFGVLGKNSAEDRDKGLTVGDLSVVTAAKRKAS